jgi:hypothetical protein
MYKTPKSAIFAAASIFALSGLALTPALAQETGSINPASITIQRIDALSNDEERSYENLSPAQLALAQDQVSANPSLAGALRAKGVKLNSVVRVIEFPNGSALVYQR